MNKWIAYLCFLLGTNALSVYAVLSVVKIRTGEGWNECRDTWWGFFDFFEVCDGFGDADSGLRFWTDFLGPTGVVLLVVGIVLFIRHKRQS